MARDYAREICEALHGTVWAGDLEAIHPILDAACAEAVAAAVADIAEVVEQDHLQITPADGSIPHAVAEDLYRQGVKRLANAIRVAQAARARTPPPGGGAAARPEPDPDPLFREERSR